MNYHITKFVDEISTHLEKGDFDIYVPLGRFEVGQIFDTMLDINFEANDEFVSIITDSINMVSERASNPLLYEDWIYEYSSVCAKIRKGHSVANKVLRKHILTDMDDRRKIAKQKPSRSHLNFLEYLLLTENNGKPLTYEEIEQNIKTVFMAVKNS